MRADDFVDFFAPDFAPEREVDFLALDLRADDFEDFLLVVAICAVLSFPSNRARESHLPPC